MDKKNRDTQSLSPEEDYRNNFMPCVHLIGRATMLLAMLLSLLPLIYFLAVKGYILSVEIYISALVGVCSVGTGVWLSEPETYWPVLGSAGTYIGYLSGNVSGMRFPVAIAVQKDMNADISTPRGQVVTIVGIVSSVVSGLAILLIIVLGGEKILSILPETVISSFDYVLISLFSAMMAMNTSASGGVKAVPVMLPHLFVSLAVWFICTKVITALYAWGMAIAVALSVLLGYMRYRRDLKKIQ